MTSSLTYAERNMHPLALAFKKTLFLHPTLNDVMEQLCDIDQPSHVERIYILTGPTGAGKSTALDCYVRHLNQVYADEMARDPSFMPYVLLRLVAPLDGRFNWKDTFIRLLSFFNEVLVERKVWDSTKTSVDGTPMYQLRMLVKEELRRALEHCVKHRGTKVIILDEASALLLAAAGITMEEQFEIIRSIVINLQVPIVLGGAYDLLGIKECNGQLIRRTRVIHFPAYTDDDFIAGGVGRGFVNFAHSLLSAMQQITIHTDIAREWRYYFIGSLGCAGLLKDWLQDAYEATLKTKEKVLTRELLDRTAFKKRDLIKIAIDLQSGREALDDASEEDLLNVFRPPTPPSPKPEKTKRAKKSPTRGRPKLAGKPGRRIAIRRPTRDPVGVSA